MDHYKVTSFDLTLALLQYFRFKRQWICVNEFRGADIVADTGREIIEVEVKVSKSDLINGEKAKVRKHQAYKFAHPFMAFNPNKFFFCVPENLVDIAVNWSAELNICYGVIGFDAKTFEERVDANLSIWHCEFLHIVKSAKMMHENYNDKLRWAIAKRTSCKITTLMRRIFESNRAAEQVKALGV